MGEQEEPELREVKEREVFAVYCPECGWFGMSDDCQYGRCPHCRMMTKREDVGGHGRN